MNIRPILQKKKEHKLRLVFRVVSQYLGYAIMISAVLGVIYYFTKK